MYGEGTNAELNTVDDSLVVRSTVVRKLSMSTYEAICDYYRSYDFSLEQMEAGLLYMINKLEQAALALGDKTYVKSVEAKSSHQKHKGGQHGCSYCSGDHKAVDCTVYKTINARKDRIVAQWLCFNCLGMGHSSKTCKSNRTCRIYHLHHHTSLCNQQSSNSKGSETTSSAKGQSSQACSSSHAQAQSHPYPPQQQQQQQQKHVVTQGKNSNTPKTPSSSSQSASVTNINLTQTSSLTGNVLPTATLDLRYFNQKLNT